MKCPILASAPRDITALQMSKKMPPSWDIGNTLDATPTATFRGNPSITQALLADIENAGFKSVRIPAAWTPHVGVGMWWNTIEMIDRATGVPKLPDLLKILDDNAT